MLFINLSSQILERWLTYGSRLLDRETQLSHHMPGSNRRYTQYSHPRYFPPPRSHIFGGSRKSEHLPPPPHRTLHSRESGTRLQKLTLAEPEPEGSDRTKSVNP